MSLQFSFIIVLYILSALIISILTVITWRIRSTQGETFWTLAMASALIVTVAWIAEIVFVDLSAKVTATKIVYIGIGGLIYFWGLFAISYSQFSKYLNRYTYIAFAIVPVVIVLTVLNFETHTLFYSDYTLVTKDGLILMEPLPGVLAWVWLIYSYAILVLSVVLLIHTYIRYPKLFKRQALLALLSVLVPAVGNLGYIANLNPIAPLDPLPIFLSISGILMLFAFRNYQFLNIVPIAYDLVFHHVHSGILILNPDGQIVRINPAAEEILNRREMDVIGQDIMDAFPEYKSLIRQFKHVDTVKTEIVLNDPAHTYELQITPLSDQKSTRVGQIIMLYDITEQKQAIDLRDRLVEEFDDYAHTVAHDLKSPLGVAIGYSSMLQTDIRQSGTEEMQFFIDEIFDTNLRMARIIEELLLLAGVRHDEDITSVSLDMLPIIAETQKRFIRQIEEKQVEFIYPEMLHSALGHSAWIEEVWANYISNAIKYGGDPTRIEIGSELDKESNMVRYWVRDNGIGLTPEEQKTVFGKFTRFERIRAQGHGLGLSIVKRIVEKLGGEVGVNSELGKGSTFYFTLPTASRDSSPLFE